MQLLSIAKNSTLPGRWRSTLLGAALVLAGPLAAARAEAQEGEAPLPEAEAPAEHAGPDAEIPPEVTAPVVEAPEEDAASEEEPDARADAKAAVKAKAKDLSVEDVLDLEELLGVPVASGEHGSFGYRLQHYGIEPYLHAYVVVDWFMQNGKVNTFDLHYFNVFVGARILDLVVPELQLEYEHGGDEIQIRYAQLDVIAIQDLLMVRSGKFLVPFGTFNEFLYPEFLSKLPDRPLALREIVPVSWAEVGAQVRGNWQWDKRTGLNYAFYVVNGLEQADDPNTAKIEDGGGIRQMRNNHVDRNHDDKAVGGRIGVQPLPWMRLGASGYTGAYTANGQQRLSMAGADFGIDWENVHVEAEYVFAHQTVTGGALNKHGGYALVSYRIMEQFEPVLQLDGIHLGGAPEDNRLRATAGLIFVPFPDQVINLVLKGAFAATVNEGNDQLGWRAIAQAAFGF